MKQKTVLFLNAYYELKFLDECEPLCSLYLPHETVADTIIEYHLF